VDPQILTTTQAVNAVFLFILGACVVLLLGITATMIWFVIRYRRSRAPAPTSLVEGNLWLEIIWIGLPVVLVMAMFWYGWLGYLTLRNVPAGALDVTATARQWSWNFTYANGKSSSKLYVPVGKPVKVNLVSLDVIHGFFLPAFRVKRDMVPGMKNHVWFVATRPGSYDLFCSLYCGTGHADMITTVEAVPEAQFVAWLQQRPGEEHPGKEQLEKHGCLGCHSLDGTPKAGPTFKGIWGRRVTVVTNGAERTLTVDEEYLRLCILEPEVNRVKGFPPVMPSFKAVLTADEVGQMVDFLKSGAAAVPKLDGAKLAKEKGCLACHSLDGSRGVGPTFKGLYNSRVVVHQDSKVLTITADDAYLRKMIRTPGVMVVEGFQPIMPTYPDLTEEEVTALVEFIEGVK
jgi:cytochrome c oxidase subunit 2